MLKKITIPLDISQWFGLTLIPCFSPFFENIQTGVSDSRLAISTGIETKSDICMLKSKFGCRQQKTNQILKIEDVAIA